MGFLQRVAATYTVPTPSSVTIPVASAITLPGSLLVAAGFGNQAGTVTSVTDSQGGTYVHDFSANVTTSAGRGLEIWRCAAVRALTVSDTITVNLGATQDHGVAVIADQFTFLGTPDVTNDASNTASVASIAVAVTATSADIVLYSACAPDGGETSLTVGSPYTLTGTGLLETGAPVLSLNCASDGAPSGTATSTWTLGTSHSLVAVAVGYPLAPPPYAGFLEFFP